MSLFIERLNMVFIVLSLSVLSTVVVPTLLYFGTTYFPGFVNLLVLFLVAVVLLMAAWDFIKWLLIDPFKKEK